MRTTTRHEFIPGPVGRLECVIDAPAAPDTGAAPGVRGLALIAHPHPLFGGSLENKVVHTLARIFVELGYIALRLNSRGVGASEGAHDEGRGEVDDLQAALAWGRRELHPGRFVLAGFSFGAAMQTKLAERLAAQGLQAERLVLVGLSPARAASSVPPESLVIHGEQDTTVPLASVMDWARPQLLPVLVVPATEHFFHRRLEILRRAVQAHFQSAPRAQGTPA